MNYTVLWLPQKGMASLKECTGGEFYLPPSNEDFKKAEKWGRSRL